MEDIRGPIQISGHTIDGAVTVTLDDSGANTARDVSIVDLQGQYPWSVIRADRQCVDADQGPRKLEREHSWRRS